MDTTTLLFFVLPLVLGLFTGAFRFMKFVGFMTGGNRQKTAPTQVADAHLSFDQRIAERLRELEHDRS